VNDVEKRRSLALSGLELHPSVVQSLYRLLQCVSLSDVEARRSTCFLSLQCASFPVCDPNFEMNVFQLLLPFENLKLKLLNEFSENSFTSCNMVESRKNKTVTVICR
jgi:hypothetical protein